MKSEPRLNLVEWFARPVIDDSHPELAGNRFGFEGGAFVRIGEMYHLFTAEMYEEPFWTSMRYGHWRSPDLRAWCRVETLMHSKGAGHERDPKFSLWSPMPVYNEDEGRWNLFYVAYRGPLAPGEGQHMDGRIFRALSQVPGMQGIGGPYEDAGIVLQPDAHSQPWEGQQGTASFYPYRAGDRWYSFYCSHNYDPPGNWPAGLVSAPALEGPWTRLPEEVNPSPIEPDFIENPIVGEIDGRFWAVYDWAEVRSGTEYVPDPCFVGYSVSGDGVRWPRGRRLAVLPEDGSGWAEDVRTPLGLSPLGGDRYAMLFTAKEKEKQFWSVGLAVVRVTA